MVVLHHLVGLPIAEIAEILGVPYGTVGSRLHHAMRALRASLDAADRAPATGGAARMTASTDFDRLLASWLDGRPARRHRRCRDGRVHRDADDAAATGTMADRPTIVAGRGHDGGPPVADDPGRGSARGGTCRRARPGGRRAAADTLGMTGNVAIVLRQPDGAVDTVDVIAVGADGTERLVRRFEPGDLRAGRRALPYGEVSLDGWFALALAGDTAASGSFALLRLDDPSRAPVFVDYVPVIGGAWSPHGGQFATDDSARDDVLRDHRDGSDHRPLAGPRQPVPARRRPQPVVGNRRVRDRRTGRRASRRRTPLDGRILLTEPSGIWWPTGERFALPGASSAPSIQRELDGAPLAASSFSADGTAVWGLYDEIRAGQHTAVLARSDGAGPARVVARVPLGEDVTHLWFTGLDTADTRIAIGSWVGEDAVMQPIRIVATASGRVASVEGNLIGFVPATSLDAPEDASASPAPTPSSSASVPVLDPVPADLVGRWVADVTDRTLVRSVRAEAPDAVDRDGGGTGSRVRPADVLVSSIAGMDPATGELVLVSDSTGDGSPLALDGTPLAPCAKGDASAYRVEPGASSSVLRLRAIRETCRARGALVSGIWSRSLAFESAGGGGVIETVRPPLYLELPGARIERRRPTAASSSAATTASGCRHGRTRSCSRTAAPSTPCQSIPAAAPPNSSMRCDAPGASGRLAEPVQLDGISGLGTGVTRVRIRTVPGACGDGREAASVATWLPRVAVGTPDVPLLVKPGEERVVHVFDYDPDDPSEPPRTMVVEALAGDLAVAASSWSR